LGFYRHFSIPIPTFVDPFVKMVNATVSASSGTIKDGDPVTWFTFYSHREKREYYYEPISGTTTWVAPSSTQGVISHLPGSPQQASSSDLLTLYRHNVLPFITRPTIAVGMLLVNLLLLSVWRNPVSLETSQHQRILMAEGTSRQTLHFITPEREADYPSEFSEIHAIADASAKFDNVVALPVFEITGDAECPNVASSVESFMDETALSDEKDDVIHATGGLASVNESMNTGLNEFERNAPQSDLQGAESAQASLAVSVIGNALSNNEQDEQHQFSHVQRTVEHNGSVTADTVAPGDGNSVDAVRVRGELGTPLYVDTADDVSFLDGATSAAGNDTLTDAEVVLEKVLTSAITAGLTIEQEPLVPHQVVLRPLEEIVSASENEVKRDLCHHRMAKLLLPHCRKRKQAIASQ
jgi:hypothetical protein